jgi:hypothetical protein
MMPNIRMLNSVLKPTPNLQRKGATNRDMKTVRI